MLLRRDHSGLLVYEKRSLFTVVLSIALCLRLEHLLLWLVLFEDVHQLHLVFLRLRSFLRDWLQEILLLLEGLQVELRVLRLHERLLPLQYACSSQISHRLRTDLLHWKLCKVR